MLSDQVSASFAAVEGAVQALGAFDWDSLPIRERLEALDRLESVRRRASATALGLVGSVERSGERTLGGVAAKVIADVVRISPAEARRRIRDAGQLQPRATLTGDVLPPALPATAKAWDAGLLDVEHLRAIQTFIKDLPEDIHPTAVEKAEAFLADKATELRPDQLAKVADRLALTLNPDGTFSDDYRALQRGFQWCGRQRSDGMSVGRLIATPELRATIDALFAKFAAPGMCNPEDQSPTVNGEPTQARADADRRRHAQRQHDALSALLRSQLGNPKLGNHNGLLGYSYTSPLDWPPIPQPAEEPPPTSAGSGGGSGTAELGVDEFLGADDVADGDAEAPLDVDGVAEVLALDVGVDVDDADGVPVVEVAGDPGAWKSVQVSVRNVSPFAVTLNAVGVTVYLTPSLLMT